MYRDPSLTLRMTLPGGKALQAQAAVNNKLIVSRLKFYTFGIQSIARRTAASGKPTADFPPVNSCEQ